MLKTLRRGFKQGITFFAALISVANCGFTDEPASPEHGIQTQPKGVFVPLRLGVSMFDVVDSSLGKKLNSHLSVGTGITLVTAPFFEWDLLDATVRLSSAGLYSGSDRVGFAVFTLTSTPAMNIPIKSSKPDRALAIRIFGGGGYSKTLATSLIDSVELPGGNSPMFTGGIELSSMPVTGALKPGVHGVGIRFNRYFSNIPVASETSILVQGDLIFDIPLAKF